MIPWWAWMFAYIGLGVAVLGSVYALLYMYFTWKHCR